MIEYDRHCGLCRTVPGQDCFFTLHDTFHVSDFDARRDQYVRLCTLNAADKTGLRPADPGNSREKGATASMRTVAIDIHPNNHFSTHRASKSHRHQAGYATVH